MSKVPAWGWAVLVVILAGAGAAVWWFWPGQGIELPEDNLLVNADFESGARGWSYPTWSEHWAGFEVDRREAHSGRRAAHLEVRNDPARSTRVWGVMQELRPKEFPHYLAGFYRVNSWEQGTPLMYLQSVIIVWRKKPAAGMNNFQVRFLLGGVAFRPTRMENVRYVHFSKAAPVQGQWTPFAVDVWEAFQSQWGYVPPEWDRINVFFEARYDEREKADAPIRAEVFYDDLYLGFSLPDFAQGLVK